MSIYNDVWPQVCLEDLVTDMQPGFAQSPNDANTGTPQLRTNNVSPAGSLDLTDLIKVRLPARKQENYLLQPGDIIFNNTNSAEWVGKTAYFAQSETFTFSNHMTRIRVDESRIDAQFLARYLHYLWQIGFSRSRSHQWVNQAAIDQSTLALFNVPIPPLPEQQRIVEILRQADELRELRKQAEAKMQNFAQSLFNSMFGQEHIIGKGWKTEPISQLGVVQYGITLNNAQQSSGREYPYLRVANVGMGFLDLTDIATIVVTQNELSKYRLSKGDLLIVEGHADSNQIGRAAVWNDEIPNCLYQNHLMRIRPFTEQVTSSYLMNYLNSPNGRLYMLRHSKTSSGLNTINSKVLEDMPVICPPIEIQRNFEECYLLQKLLVTQKQQALVQIDTLFQSLLARAFSGQLTEKWRERHRGELQVMETGLRINLEREREKRRQGRQLAWIEAGEPRTALLTELSEEQEAILQALSNGHRYLTAQMITDDVSLPLHDVRESLRLLRDTGLIQEVELPGRAGGREMTYISAFRRLLSSDLVQADDIKLLREEMSL